MLLWLLYNKIFCEEDHFCVELLVKAVRLYEHLQIRYLKKEAVNYFK